MSDMIYYKNGEETFRISPPTVGTKCPETKLEVKKMTEKEQLKAQIQELQEQLQKLEEISPIEEAYKRVYGFYPETYEDNWSSFQDGYIAAQKDYKVGEFQPKEKEQKWDVVRESVKWCEENPDKNPLDWLKPQTPEQTEQGLKEAFREAVKQGVVSSTTKPQTLSDLIYDWWERVFGDTDDTETCIENLVDEISLWLPTEHDTNSYKWNECIRMIREKLR